MLEPLEEDDNESTALDDNDKDEVDDDSTIGDDSVDGKVDELEEADELEEEENDVGDALEVEVVTIGGGGVSARRSVNVQLNATGPSHRGRRGALGSMRNAMVRRSSQLIIRNRAARSHA